MTSSETEELRLVNSHLRTAIRKAVTMARNCIRAGSADPEDWRADMQVLADDLEGIQEPHPLAPSSETEELRLVNSHLRTAIRKAVTMARNCIRTNSADADDWRADLKMLTDDLERIQEGNTTPQVEVQRERQGV